MRTHLLALPAAAVAIVVVGGAVRAGPPEQAHATAAAILEIIDSRAARMPAIDAYKARGVIGESNVALVEIVALDPIDEPDARIEVERVVRAENADRERLYALLASQGPDQDRDARLRNIREKYAKILRDAARAGDWMQLQDGTWERKKKEDEGY